MATNEKTFANMLRKAKKERKELTAQGMESYPIRAYEVYVTIIERGEERSFILKNVGGYDSVEDDKKYILENVKRALDNVFYMAKVFGKRIIKIKSIEIKLLKEY